MTEEEHASLVFDYCRMLAAYCTANYMARKDIRLNDITRSKLKRIGDMSEEFLREIPDEVIAQVMQTAPIRRKGKSK